MWKVESNLTLAETPGWVWCYCWYVWRRFHSLLAQPAQQAVQWPLTKHPQFTWIQNDCSSKCTAAVVIPILYLDQSIIHVVISATLEAMTELQPPHRACLTVYICMLTTAKWEIQGLINAKVDRAVTITLIRQQCHVMHWTKCGLICQIYPHDKIKLKYKILSRLSLMTLEKRFMPISDDAIVSNNNFSLQYSYVFVCDRWIINYVGVVLTTTLFASHTLQHCFS